MQRQIYNNVVFGIIYDNDNLIIDISYKNRDLVKSLGYIPVNYYYAVVKDDNMFILIDMQKCSSRV